MVDLTADAGVLAIPNHARIFKANKCSDTALKLSIIIQGLTLNYDKTLQ